MNKLLLIISIVLVVIILTPVMALVLSLGVPFNIVVLVLLWKLMPIIKEIFKF